MSFNPGLEKKFKGMFGNKRLDRKLRLFQETGSSKVLDNSDDEADVPSKPTSIQQTENKNQPTAPQDSASQTKPATDGNDKAEEPKRRHRLDEKGRNRYIQRWWPRDPNGPVIPQGWSGGKMTSNGNPQWGATLLDFYGTNRVPSVGNFVLFSSGSRLAAFMRKIGEKECAWSQDELDWADAEEEPKQLFPVDTGELIRCADRRVVMGRSMPKQDSDRSESEPQVDPTNPFLPQNYPSPWPTVPFTAPNPTLETRIPYHLLPEKLIVHDPWGVLSAHRVRDDEVRWEDKKDVTYTYHLSLSKAGLAKKKQSKEDALKEWSDKCAKQATLFFGAGSIRDENGLVAAPAVVELPPPPRPVTEVPEAHVYFSPAKAVGSGNHSYVYDVEWELPRSVFFQPQICKTCVISELERVLAEKFKDRELPRGTLERETRLKKAGVTVEIVTKNEFYCEAFKRKDVDTAFGLDECPPDAQPPKTPDNPKRTQDLTDPEYETIDTYKGDILRVRQDETNIQYQHPHTGLGPCCKHLSPQRPVPLTSTVRVTAKISRQYDEHLSREARNYQDFPDHFFEHWNGYNLVAPIHDPVPVGAVVPQFYGYYKPDSDQTVSNSDSDSDDDTYLSPIILMEDCGQQINVDKLNYDDKNECASLFYRLHSAGWLHQSVFPRNVLVKKGSLFDWPIARSSEDRRFRLIDFGRSHKVDIPKEYKGEKFFHRMTGVGKAPPGRDGSRMEEEIDVAQCVGISI